jgi:hypothetical protein
MKDFDQGRRWLINAGGAAVLAGAMPIRAAAAKGAGAAARGGAGRASVPDPAYVSPLTSTLS